MRVGRGGLGYLAATFALLVVACGLLWAWGVDGRAGLAVGAAVAWIVQAPAYGALVDRLDRGLDATRVWIGGMGARLGGFAILAVASWLSALPVAPVAVSYAITMVVLLVLEAAWLARRRLASGG
jgi:hypothetical protein